MNYDTLLSGHRSRRLRVGLAGAIANPIARSPRCATPDFRQAKLPSRRTPNAWSDGDQPSLLVALVSWARLLGLEVVCAGKAGEFDFVFDPAPTTIRGPAGGANA